MSVWDNTNCKWALAFNPWSRGNGLVNVFTGNMPSFPSGAFQNCQFVNFTSTYGFVPFDRNGHCRFDGAGDRIASSLGPAHTDASKFTFESKVFFTDIVSGQALFSQSDDASNRLVALVLGDKRLNFAFRVGGVEDRALSSTTLGADGPYTLHFQKNAGTLRTLINGVEVSYSEANTYALGNKTYTDTVSIGGRGNPFFDNYWADRMRWIAYYDDAISDARMLANHNNTLGLGQVGFNTGDSMALFQEQIARSIFNGTFDERFNLRFN